MHILSVGCKCKLKLQIYVLGNDIKARRRGVGNSQSDYVNAPLSMRPCQRALSTRTLTGSGWSCADNNTNLHHHTHQQSPSRRHKWKSPVLNKIVWCCAPTAFARKECNRGCIDAKSEFWCSESWSVISDPSLVSICHEMDEFTLFAPMVALFQHHALCGFRVGKVAHFWAWSSWTSTFYLSGDLESSLARGCQL